jgi:threonine/homoserine/homoserine lactone efflux protein
MLKLLLKIIAAIGLIVFGIFVLIKALPWVIGIVAVVGVIIELYHLWHKRNEGGAPSAPCGKEP